MNEGMDWLNTETGKTAAAETKFTPNSPSKAGLPGQMLPELLNGFIAEVKSYLPKVERALTDYYADPQQPAFLVDAHRHVRTLKGAAAVVGLTPLSDIAISLEEILEKLSAKASPLPISLWEALKNLLAQLDLYLNGVAAGQPDVPLGLTHALRALRVVEGLQIKSHSKPRDTSGAAVTPLPSPSNVPDHAAPPASSPAVPLPSPPVPIGLAKLPNMEDLSAWLDLNDDDDEELLNPFVKLPPPPIKPVEFPTLAPVTKAMPPTVLAGTPSGTLPNMEDLSAWLDMNDDDTVPLAEFVQSPLSPSVGLVEPPPPSLTSPSSAETPLSSPMADAAIIFRPMTEAEPDLSAWLDLNDDDDDGLLDPLPLIAPAQRPKEAAQPFTSTAAPLSALTALPLVEEAVAPLPAVALDTAPAVEPAPAPTSLPSETAPEVAMPEISAELLEVFLPEAEEHLRVMTLSLPALAAQPGNKALLQEIRRSAHSLKGSAAVVGFEQIAKLAHRAEDLLDLLYDGELTLNQEHLQLLFASTEALDNLLNNRPAQSMLTALYETYTELLSGGAREGQSPSSPELATEEAVKNNVDGPRRTTQPLMGEIPEKEDPTSTTEPMPATVLNRGKDVRVPIERLDAVVKLVTELLVNQASFEQSMVRFQRQLEEIRDNSARLARVSAKMEVQFEVSTLGGKPILAPSFAAPVSMANGLSGSFGRPGGFTMAAPEVAPKVTLNTYGFDALEFDRYTDFHLLLRELTEATSDVQTLERELGEVKDLFDSSLNRQARLCSEIQEQLMRLRLVPLATLSSRLHRTAHTVAARRGKRVDFAIEGEDVRLDKTVIEEIADPLLHLLRNAIDHGIEAPAARQAKGKPPSGTIRLRAFHEGTQTVIQIGDDGAGLNLERITEKALKNGLITPVEQARMTDEELFSLIFLPGFSTAAEVTEISGRGVGMDVVKSTVHRLKGSVYVDSRAGAGTVFTVRLPMTLAVMRALMVKTGSQNFAVPVAGLSQVVKLTPNVLEKIGQDTVVRTEGRVYPLLQLSKLLNLPDAEPSSGTQLALLMTLDERPIAIAVDETLGGREIVVKNLGNHLRRVHGVTGATLLGDGQVVLILNLLELVRDVFRPRAQMVDARTAYKGETQPEARPEAPVSPTANPGRAADAPLTVMVVDDSLSVRRVLSNRLTSAGWTPLQAKDGLDALEQLQHMTIPPDLVLVDIEMPRMDGYEFISTLRKQEEYKDLPMIVLTSRAGKKHRDRAFDVGATEYLVKPYQDDVLLSLIRRLADGPTEEK